MTHVDVVASAGFRSAYGNLLVGRTRLFLRDRGVTTVWLQISMNGPSEYIACTNCTFVSEW